MRKSKCFAIGLYLMSKLLLLKRKFYAQAAANLNDNYFRYFDACVVVYLRKQEVYLAK